MGAGTALPELFRRAGVCASSHRAIPDAHVCDVTADSRRVVRGGMFVAVCGTEVDGHDYVGQAAESGASVVVVEGEVSCLASCLQVVVDDSRAALAKLAAAFYGLRGGDGTPLRLVGVTGTNGKTTVAWLLRSILREAAQPAALLGTIEYDLLAERFAGQLTTPGPVELCQHLVTASRAGARNAIVEVSSHALDQRRCAGLSFAAGVFTNLSGDHLDYHGTMAAYASAKRRLFDLLDEDGKAVINADDEVGVGFARELGETAITFGLDSSPADVSATIEELNVNGARFRLRGRSFDESVCEIRWRLIGRHNVLNALAAAATAEALGIEPEVICHALARAEGAPGRLQRAEPPGYPFSVFVDYAHTDAALGNVLAALKTLTRGRLICVFGCGGDRDRSKRPRMAAEAGRWADMALVTSDNPRTEDPQGIIDQIMPGFGNAPRCRVVVEVERRRAIGTAIHEARPGDTVLIAGKGHEDYQIVGTTRQRFDDVTVAREFLHERAAVGEVA